MSDMANIRNQRRFRKPVFNIYGIFDERVPKQMPVPVQAVDRDQRYRPKTEVPVQNMDRDPHQTFARIPTCTGARDFCKPTEKTSTVFAWVREKE